MRVDAHATYAVRVEPLPDLDVLGAWWLELQGRSACSIFLSWLWIGTWLTIICPRHTARLATVERDGRRIGMGIFTLRRRFPGIGPRHLRLHETGNQELDSLTIEYNGLLAEEGHERSVLDAVVQHFVREGGWLSLHLPGIDAQAVPEGALLQPGIELRRLLRPTRHVELDDLRARAQDYASSLSAGTRTHLRRTENKIAQLAGPIRLEVGASRRERHEFFDALVQMHQQHWRDDRKAGGAFSDPQILAFHRSLIDASRTGTGVELLRLSAGTDVVGYVYSLNWRGITYFYQSGIDYRRFGRCGSPGLLLLSFAIQQALESGTVRYELMAGEAAYKRSLGSSEGRMLWLSIDRVGLLGRGRRLWWALQRSRG